jgi:hypothetical protein
MSSGRTHSSNCSGVMSLRARQASLRVVPSSCAFLAALAALSYPKPKLVSNKEKEQVHTNLRVQSSDKHEGLTEDGADPLGVGFNAIDAVYSERQSSIAQKSYGVEYVLHHNGLEDVQLEE